MILRLRIIIGVCAAAILAPSLMVYLSCSSDSSKGEKLSGEIREMVRYYQEMKEIGLAGRVEEFLARRDSVTNAEIAQYFEWKKWIIDSIKVSNWSYNWPDVSGLPLEQDTSDGQWRRLVFRKCGLMDKDGKEQCLYPVIMWRKNGDEWKVSNASNLASYRYNNDGSLRTLSELTFHRMFRIPPDFRDLKQKEGPSQFKPEPIDPKDIPGKTK